MKSVFYQLVQISWMQSSPPTMANYDFEDLIEFCPESPNDIYQLNTIKYSEPYEETTAKVLYVCSLCLRQYNLQEDLRGHMIEYHKYRLTSLAVDNKPVMSVKDITEECVLSKEDGTDFDCLIDNKRTDTESDPELRPVPFKDFRIILRSKMKLRCSVTTSCVFKFKNSTELELHVKCHTNVAASGQQFKCPECAMEATNWRRCSAHLWKMHQIDVDLLQCPLCTFKAHASVIVWRHMRMHVKWRPRVLRSRARAVQQKRHYNVQKLSELTSQPVLNKNKYYAEKTCEICNRQFVNGKTLSKHVKTVHNKIKPFICNVCGRKTARKASLIIHMRQHTGEKPLHCKTCKFATRDPSVLHKHQLRHEMAGKFKCEICDYSCIQTNSFKRHMRLNHPQEYKRLACNLCTYVTINEQKLKAHKEDHRKGLIVNHEDSMDATRAGCFKNPRKMHDKNNEISADCFMPLESIDSLPHEPAVDTGGVTIPAPSEDTQFPTYLNN